MYILLLKTYINNLFDMIMNKVNKLKMKYIVYLSNK
jgi:hypothetical protein